MQGFPAKPWREPMTEPVAHPWMANSVPALKAAMLAEIGAGSIEELFEQIPADHRLRRPLTLPPGQRSEASLKRHLTSLLSRTESCEQNLSFLGAGCWQHHVPAVVDEIVGRFEFLTNVWGSPQSDFGRNQAWFEYASQLGELVGMEVVSLPVYSWGCAAGHAIRMAARITGRQEVLLPRVIDPERQAVIASYCEPRSMSRHIDMVAVGFEPATGRLDLADLERRLSDGTAAVYLESPSYLGVIEADGARIAELAHRHGALLIVGADPISLGVLKAPADWGADIVVGPTQPLGRAHELRRRRGRLHRDARTRTGSCASTMGSWSRSPAPRSPASSASASRPRTRPPTACASSARTGPATRSISGPSPTRSTSPCSARPACARSARRSSSVPPMRRGDWQHCRG